MAYGGAAVGRLDSGAAVFVPGGLPGELVEAQVIERKRNFARAGLLQVLEPAPARIDPPCPHFMAGCGGCEWQHAAYDAQLGYKQRILVDQLERLGKLPNLPLLPPVPSPLEFRYRNVAEFHLQGGALGFHRASSHQLVDVDSCPIVEDSINRALPAVREALAGQAAIEQVDVRNGADGLLVTLLGQTDPRAHKLLAAGLAERLGGDCRVAGVRIGSDRTRGLHGQPFVHMQLAGKRFRVSAQSFFQVNSQVAEKLAGLVTAEVGGGERVLDLFSGVGTFALLASERAREVVGVEEHPSATGDAHANAAEFAAGNVQFRQADVASAVDLAAERWDLTILDPPRAGCARPVLEALNSNRIVYVSCDPSTLARDVAVLAARGYSLSSLQLLDMFPQTYHLEALAVLAR